MTDAVRSPRLLLVEDNPGDVRLIREMLAESGAHCAVTVASSLAETSLILQTSAKEIDVVLLDLNLPDSMGIETMLRLNEMRPGLPVIVLTGILDEQFGARAVSAGAQDFLAKGQIDPLLLMRSIRYSIERWKNDDALRKSEERFKNLFNSTLDGIYQVDGQGKFTLVNQAGAEIFGFRSPDEMIGQDVHAFWVDLKEREKYVAELQRRGSVKNYPMRARRRTGEEIHLEASSHVLEDGEGRFMGIEGILRDVTDHRKLEEQFRQAQKIEAIGQLAGGVAHDFNNILSAIIGYANLMEMKLRPDDPLHHDLEQVLAAAQRATALTQSLLAFSRKQPVSLEPHDVNQIVKEFEKFLHRLIREDIELRIVPASGELMVMVDRGQIEQVIMNLVTNARDAMPEGGQLTINMSTERLGADYIRSHGYGKEGTYAQMTITDTGVGMDSSTSQRLFEPFFTTKEPGKGTGLGLATSYGIVKKHDGFISVSSEVGKGSEFSIYLPLIKMRASGPAKPTEQIMRTTPRGTETVLFAEDDASLRRLITTVLEHFGYTVISAVDGNDAIAKFVDHRESIKLLLLDGVMPKKGGYEAYREISALQPGMKVIFVSGYSEEVFGRQNAEPGMHFLMKPVAPTKLLGKVREVLDGS